MTAAHFYDNLNTATALVLEMESPRNEYPVRVALSGEDVMQVLVEAVLTSNHGLHRFCSELQDQLVASQEHVHHNIAHQVLVDAIHLFFEQY